MELACRALQVENLLLERKYEDIAFHLTYFETYDVTLEILQQTDIVSVIYRVLKSCPQGDLRGRTKCLLSKWKTLYKKGCVKTSTLNNERPMCKDNRISEKVAISCRDPLQQNDQRILDVGIPSISMSSNEEYLNKESSTHEPCCNHPKFAVNLCQEKIAVEDSALRTTSTALLCRALTENIECQEKAQHLAEEIEKYIFSLHSGNDKKYRNCIRSKVSNLKNPQNKHLRSQLFSGDLSPMRFAQMSSMEMASQELRKLRARYTEAGIQEHQLPQSADGVQTNKIKCQKCENFNCTVTMISRGTLFLPGWVRTGNPDEEMMTFVVCSTCGEKWYHDKWICL
ncbi:transcription elongation factor A N-terminal and central domain-containing protein [Pelobates fuscus]|uniref:transcription elongation factor A N-terminal and central domain-containing protein n=1 Tax=Pelobates fuscus TaxID=191477 RepID=UPI002FE44AB5